MPTPDEILRLAEQEGLTKNVTRLVRQRIDVSNKRWLPAPSKDEILTALQRQGVTLQKRGPRIYETDNKIAISGRLDVCDAALRAEGINFIRSDGTIVIV